MEAGFDEETWTSEEASLVWRLDPVTGQHAPTLEFPFQMSIKGELEVTVKSARDIVFSRIGGGIRTFVELKLGTVKQGTTAVKFENNLATWDQTLEPLEVSSESHILRIAVFQHSKHFKHPKIGVAYIPVSDLSNCMMILKDKTAENAAASPFADSHLSGSTVSAKSPVSKADPSENNPFPYYVEYPFVVDLRDKPTTDASALNGRSIAAGTVFWVVEKLEKEDAGTLVNDGRNTFLRLADNAGWIFTTHQKDGRQIVKSTETLQEREETQMERKYDIVKEHQSWVELQNNKKNVGRVLLHFKLYITSERERIEGKDQKMKKFKKKKKKKKKLFGGELAMAVDSSSGEEIPRLCKVLVEFLQQNALETEGLFRVPGNHVEMKKIEDSFEKGNGTIDLKEVHDAGGVLKKYFRDLKTRIIPNTHTKSLFEIAEGKDDNKTKIEKYKFLLSTLPVVNKASLDFLLAFLYQVSLKSETNKMTTKNLAVVWAPNLFSSKCMEFTKMISVVQVLIQNHTAIFGKSPAATSSHYHMMRQKMKMKGGHRRTQSSSFRMSSDAMKQRRRTGSPGPPVRRSTLRGKLSSFLSGASQRLSIFGTLSGTSTKSERAKTADSLTPGGSSHTRQKKADSLRTPLTVRSDILTKYGEVSPQSNNQGASFALSAALARETKNQRRKDTGKSVELQLDELSQDRVDDEDNGELEDAAIGEHSKDVSKVILANEDEETEKLMSSGIQKKENEMKEAKIKGVSSTEGPQKRIEASENKNEDATLTDVEQEDSKSQEEPKEEEASTAADEIKYAEETEAAALPDEDESRDSSTEEMSTIQVPNSPGGAGAPTLLTISELHSGRRSPVTLIEQPTLMSDEDEEDDEIIKA